MTNRPTELLGVAELNELLEGRALRVVPDVAPFDGMHNYAPELYFEAGHSALRHIRLAMLTAELEQVDSILDFASGAGRVLRTLMAAFPDATLIASDVWKRGLEFCSEVLGVETVESSPEPAEVDLEGPFDVIWCGSLLTHVDARRWTGFVKVFESLLSPGGVAVFTTYGRFTAGALRKREITLSLSDEQIEQLLRDYDNTGFGYCERLPEEGLGDFLASRAWVGAQMDQAPTLRLVLYNERGWLGQDVIACTKPA
jgi:SAM-dependent methyltransferase